MFSAVSKFLSFVVGGDDDDEDDDFMKRRLELASSSDEDQQDRRTETKEWIGRVTAVYGNHCLLDGIVYVDQSCLQNARMPEVNTRLRVTASRQGKHGGWKASSAVVEEEVTISWDDMHNLNEPNEEDEDELTVAMVTNVNKDGATLNNGHTFNLSDIITEHYKPQRRDWVLMKITRDSDMNAVITDVKPLRVWSFDDVIVSTAIRDHGYLEGGIYYTTDVCEEGYVPQKGQRVSGQALESEQGQCNWRAFHLTRSSLRHQFKSSASAISSPMMSQLTAKLLADKEGIEVQPGQSAVEFGRLQLGASRSLHLTLRNSSGEVRTLRKCSVRSLTSSVQFQVSSVSMTANQASSDSGVRSSVELPVDVTPNTYVNITVKCTANCLGKDKQMVVLDFGSFKIARHLEVVVYDIQQFGLAPNKPYQRRQTERGTPVSTADNWLIPGQKPSSVKVNLKLPNRLPQYPVPDGWRECLTSDGATGLLDLIPCLAQELELTNYADRFSALLHLEEIQQQIDMREFDLFMVSLRCHGEYLALSVPGLAEGRPSLLIGDRVILTNPALHDQGPQYEGYIHEVLKDEVLLKFHEGFHDNYTREEYNVTFTFNRTSFRRCHQAARLASSLGEDVLFPSRLVAKPSQMMRAARNKTPDTNVVAVSPVRTARLPNNQARVPNQQARPLNQQARPPSQQTRVPSQQAQPPSQQARVLSQQARVDTTGSLKLFNTSLNARQKVAVLRILNGHCRPTPYLLYGPPGTGKTVTLVEAVLQVMTGLPHSRILICTPSNSAADLITERLHMSGEVKCSDMVRINAFQRTHQTIPDVILPYCRTADDLEVLSRYRVIVSTCVSAGMMYALNLKPGHFTHAFIDEAGQATEAECLIPIALVACHSEGQVVLAGDPMQLGPVLRSRYSNRFGLGLSLLERLIQRPLYARDEKKFAGHGSYDPFLVTKLVQNYRSHPALLSIPSRLFYHGELEVSADQSITHCLCAWDKLPNNNNFPLVFHGIRGEDVREGSSPSWFNPMEALQVMRYLQSLVTNTCHSLTWDDIGIITPYRKQVEKIRLLIDKLGMDKVKVGSVEEFQGQERLVIIISTVRSNECQVGSDVTHNLGFLLNPKRFNVSITRAQAALIVIGNPHILVQDDYWRELLQYCVDNKGYTGCDLPADITAPSDPTDDVTAPSDPTDDVTALSDLTDDVTAPSDLTDDVTAPSDLTDDVTAPSDLTDDVTAPSDPTDDVTAQSDPTDDITAPSDLTDDVTAPSDLTDDVTAPSDLTDDVTAPSDLTDEVTAPSDLTDDITAPSDPTDDITAPSDPTDDFTAPSDPTDDITTPSDLTDDVNAPSDPTDDLNATSDPTDDITAPSDLTDDVNATSDLTDDVTAPSDPIDDITAPSDPTDDVTAPSGPTNDVTEFTNHTTCNTEYIYNRYMDIKSNTAAFSDLTDDITAPNDLTDDNTAVTAPNDLSTDTTTYDDLLTLPNESQTDPAANKNTPDHLQSFTIDQVSVSDTQPEVMCNERQDDTVNDDTSDVLDEVMTGENRRVNGEVSSVEGYNETETSKGEETVDRGLRKEEAPQNCGELMSCVGETKNEGQMGEMVKEEELCENQKESDVVQPTQHWSTGDDAEELLELNCDQLNITDHVEVFNESPKKVNNGSNSEYGNDVGSTSPIDATLSVPRPKSDEFVDHLPTSGACQRLSAESVALPPSFSFLTDTKNEQSNEALRTPPPAKIDRFGDGPHVGAVQSDSAVTVSGQGDSVDIPNIGKSPGSYFAPTKCEMRGRNNSSAENRIRKTLSPNSAQGDSVETSHSVDSAPRHVAPNKCEIRQRNNSSAERRTRKTPSPNPELDNMIIKQVEYYFGDFNLMRDHFLLDVISQDPDGWVSVDLLMTFNRMKLLSHQPHLILDALNKSTSGLLECDCQGLRVRRSPHRPRITDHAAWKTNLTNRTVLVSQSQGQRLEVLESFFEGFGRVEHIEKNIPHHRQNKRPPYHSALYCLVVFVSKFSAQRLANSRHLHIGHTRVYSLFKCALVEAGIDFMYRRRILNEKPGPIREPAPPRFRKDQNAQGYREDRMAQGSREDHGGQGFREDHRGQGFRESHRGQGFREDHRGQGFREDHKGQGFREDHKAQGFREDHKAQGFREDQRGHGFREDHKAQGFTEDHKAQGFTEDHRGHAFREDHRGQGFREDHKAQGFREDHRGQGFREDHKVQGFREDHKTQGYREDHSAPHVTESHSSPNSRANAKSSSKKPSVEDLLQQLDNMQYKPISPETACVHPFVVRGFRNKNTTGYESDPQRPKESKTETQESPSSVVSPVSTPVKESKSDTNIMSGVKPAVVSASPMGGRGRGIMVMMNRRSSPKCLTITPVITENVKSSSSDGELSVNGAKSGAESEKGEDVTHKGVNSMRSLKQQFSDCTKLELESTAFSHHTKADNASPEFPSPETSPKPVEEDFDDFQGSHNYSRSHADSRHVDLYSAGMYDDDDFDDDDFRYDLEQRDGDVIIESFDDSSESD